MSQSPGGLPAAIQREILVSAYVFAGSTAVLFWDILNNLRGDYSLLFRQKFHLTTAVYVASRIASSVYVLGFTIFASYPLHTCSTAYLAFNCFYPIGVSANAFLFFSRVRAIYGGSRLITILFGFLWLAVLGSSITIPIGGTAIELSDPTECIVGPIKGYVGSSGIIVAVHDTLVFFAISYRLVANYAYEQQERTRGSLIKVLLSGTNLPAFSKALFTDGQMYYMITVISNIVTIIMLYVPRLTPVYHGLLVIPNLTVTSIMACRVYRNTKLGVGRGGVELSLPTLNSVSRDPEIPLSVVQLSTQRTGVTSLARSEGDGYDSAGDKSER